MTDFHLGLALAFALLGPAIYSGLALSADLEPLARTLAVAVIALAQLTLTSVAAGLCGQLSLAALIPLGIACALAARRFRAVRAEWANVDVTAPGILALVSVPLALSAMRALLAPPMNWDSLAYHLPVVVDWLNAGSLARHLPLPMYPPQVPYFPEGGELAWFWAMAPWHAEFAGGLVNHAFLLLTAAGVAAVALELGAPAEAAWVAAGLYALLPIHFASLLGTANVDLYLAFTTVAGAYFVLRRRALLAGVACGLGIGVKLTGLTVPPVLVVLAFARGWRPDRQLASAALAALALCGVWYARNALVTGSPTYPWPTGALGRGERFVDLPLTAALARELAEAVWNQIGPWTLAAAAAWLVHAGVALRAVARSEPQRMLHLAWVAGAFGLTALWVLLPATAYLLPYNLRYALPGLALVAPSVALALDRGGLTGAGGALAAAQLLACAPHLALPAKWALLALAGLCAAALAVRSAVRGHRVLALCACVALDLVGLAAFTAHMRPEVRYDWFLAGYHDGQMRTAAKFADGLAGARIAAVGPLPPYLLYGSRFQNRVVWLSVEAHGEALPHQLPGGLLRQRPDRAAWLAALDLQHPDYLVISRGTANDPWPPEREWAIAVGERFTVVAGEPTLEITKVQAPR